MRAPPLHALALRAAGVPTHYMRLFEVPTTMNVDNDSQNAGRLVYLQGLCEGITMCLQVIADAEDGNAGVLLLRRAEETLQDAMKDIGVGVHPRCICGHDSSDHGGPDFCDVDDCECRQWRIG